MKRLQLVVCALLLSLAAGCGAATPSVTGASLDSATARLESAGFRVGRITYDASASETTGTVIVQVPAASERADSGTPVSLTVAGPAPVATPNVVGMDKNGAAAVLSKAGLLLGQVSQRQVASVPAGRVVSQLPPVGEMAAPGSAVAVVVSSGPESVRIPNVRGRSEARARERLEAAGFKVKVLRVASGKPKDTVVSQKPGGRAQPGTKITISVSTGGASGNTAEASSGDGSSSGSDAAARAFSGRKSGVQISGAGTVIRLLSDDDNGSRHQRFILRLASGQTLLVAHNIDIAPRVPSLATGDSVSFRGVYEWNAEGGTVHWTHHDPDGDHPAGWLKHGGSTYQ